MSGLSRTLAGGPGSPGPDRDTGDSDSGASVRRRIMMAVVDPAAEQPTDLSARGRVTHTERGHALTREFLGGLVGRGAEHPQAAGPG